MTRAEPHELWQQAWDRRRADPARALELAEDARRGAEDVGDKHGIARALLASGACHWRLSDYPRALACLLGALPDLAEDDEGLAMTHQELGTVYNYLGDHAASLEHSLESLRIRERLGEDAGRADVLNNMGIFFYHRGEFGEATRSYEQSLALRLQLGDDLGVAGARNNLAKVGTDQGRYDEALGRLDAASRLWEGLGEERGLAMALNNRGLVYERQRDLDAAAGCYQESLERKARIGDLQGTSETLRRLGRVYCVQGRVEEGLELLGRAAKAAEEVGSKPEHLEACRELSAVPEELGDHQAALEWYKRLHELERELFSEQRVRGLQVAFQLERAERESNTDALTGLHNRRYADRRLREQFVKARREGRPLPVALCDLDFFKRVNDELSHAVGDAVLRAVAAILRDHVRAADVVARYGGEEFVVVLPDTPLQGATRAAEALCARVREHPWPSIHPRLAVTMSIGVATDADADDHESLLAAADTKLYLAKHAGKNRVRS